MKNSKSLPSTLRRAPIFEEKNETPSQKTGLLRRKSESFRGEKKSQVFLEGYVGEEDDLCRTKSLTDSDLEELKGCLDLGFGFNYEKIPELCNTLPALELCYSMSQKYNNDEQHKNNESMSASSNNIANWKFSSPGDDPEDVKARLKYWAQAVSCTLKLCSQKK